MRLRSLFTLLFMLALSITLLFQACSSSGSTDADTITNRMATEHQTDRPVATPLAFTEPAIPVSIEPVEYATVDGQPVIGYLAKPEDAAGGLPGIIAIHEWWGLNDNIKATAQRLAGEGYTVLAVDLYGGQFAEAPEQARSLMQAVMQNPEPANSNLKQAYDYLVNQQMAPTVGSIGWCFGGGWSLRTGLLLPNQLDAVVIYYGRLVTDPADLEPLQMPILGLFGATDQAIPVEQVNAFEAALDSLDKPAEIYVYENAGHAFANPSGNRYEPEAAEDAWEKTTTFFREHLQES